MMTVTYQDCVRELIDRGGPTATETLRRWRARPGYASVVSFVENFSHQYLFEVTSNAVELVVEQSEHALGDVESAEQIAAVEDFTTPFAFQHLFHWLLEDTRQVPTWDVYREWMVRGEAARLWFGPIKEHLSEALPNARKAKLQRAIKWRLGKVYLSNIRELHLIASLHERGVRYRYHLLADVLLRCDLWLDDLVLCTYTPSARYRDNGAGRKPPASSFLQDADPKFRIEHVRIERQGFGKIWLVSEQEIDAIARLATATDAMVNAPPANDH